MNLSAVGTVPDSDTESDVEMVDAMEVEDEEDDRKPAAVDLTAQFEACSLNRRIDAGLTRPAVASVHQSLLRPPTYKPFATTQQEATYAKKKKSGNNVSWNKFVRARTIGATTSKKNSKKKQHDSDSEEEEDASLL